MGDIISATETFVKKTLVNAEAGHGWWHIHRVRHNALRIAKAEGANLLIVELGALLHDIADHKFHQGDHERGSRVAREWLESQRLDSAIVDTVCDVVFHVSFRGLRAENGMESLEGKCVQDADRLEGIGAIGIARTIIYGATIGRALYDPDGPVLSLDAPWHVDVHTPSPSTIHHFYEKILHVKDWMHTPTGQALAEERHIFTQQYLNQFFKEWNQ